MYNKTHWLLLHHSIKSHRTLRQYKFCYKSCWFVPSSFIKALPKVPVLQEVPVHGSCIPTLLILRPVRGAPLQTSSLLIYYIAQDAHACQDQVPPNVDQPVSSPIFEPLVAYPV